MTVKTKWEFNLQFSDAIAELFKALIVTFGEEEPYSFGTYQGKQFKLGTFFYRVGVQPYQVPFKELTHSGYLIEQIGVDNDTLCKSVKHISNPEEAYNAICSRTIAVQA